MVVNRYDVWLVSLDPTQGSEIANTRPCIVISPDQVNRHLNTIIVAPQTSTRKLYPTRVNCQFDNRDGQIALDQSRSVEKSRLVKKIGQLDEITSRQVCDTLVILFTY